MKVDFLIAGAQKSGTSALRGYLLEHPEICMAHRKEVHFFDNENIFQSQIATDYSIYHSFFNPSERHKILGEATPVYMYWYNAPRRIWEYNPSIKIIIILRNPIERAYSHWNMQRGRGIDNLSFLQGIKAERERCRIALPHQHPRFSYIDRGFYVEQLRRIWHYIPRAQTLIFKNEDLRYNPIETLYKVYDFLGISIVEAKNIQDIHSREYRSKMTTTEREVLKSIYENEIKELEKVLHWDCSEWLE